MRHRQLGAAYALDAGAQGRRVSCGKSQGDGGGERGLVGGAGISDGADHCAERPAAEGKGGAGDTRRVHRVTKTGGDRFPDADVVSAVGRLDVTDQRRVFNAKGAGCVAGRAQAVAGCDADHGLGGVGQRRGLECIGWRCEVDGERLPRRAIVGGNIHRKVTCAGIGLPGDGLGTEPGVARRVNGDRRGAGRRRNFRQHCVVGNATDLYFGSRRGIGCGKGEKRGAVAGLRLAPGVKQGCADGKGSCISHDLLLRRVEKNDLIRAGQRRKIFSRFHLIPRQQRHRVRGARDDAIYHQQRLCRHDSLGQRGALRARCIMVHHPLPYRRIVQIGDPQVFITDLFWIRRHKIHIVLFGVFNSPLGHVKTISTGAFIVLVNPRQVADFVRDDVTFRFGVAIVSDQSGQRRRLAQRRAGVAEPILVRQSDHHPAARGAHTQVIHFPQQIEFFRVIRPRWFLGPIHEPAGGRGGVKSHSTGRCGRIHAGNGVNGAHPANVVADERAQVNGPRLAIIRADGDRAHVQWKVVFRDCGEAGAASKGMFFSTTICYPHCSLETVHPNIRRRKPKIVKTIVHAPLFEQRVAFFFKGKLAVFAFMARSFGSQGRKPTVIIAPSRFGPHRTAGRQPQQDDVIHEHVGRVAFPENVRVRVPADKRSEYRGFVFYERHAFEDLHRLDCDLDVGQRPEGPGKPLFQRAAAGVLDPGVVVIIPCLLFAPHLGNVSDARQEFFCGHESKFQARDGFDLTFHVDLVDILVVIIDLKGLLVDGGGGN